MSTTETTTRLERFIADQVAASPIEAGIVRRIVAALNQAGWPVLSVWDGEERTAVESVEDVFAVVFNLDEAILETDNGNIFLTMGEGWDIICDYHTGLESALTPVNDHIQANW